MKIFYSYQYQDLFFFKSLKNENILFEIFFKNRTLKDLLVLYSDKSGSSATWKEMGAKYFR